MDKSNLKEKTISGFIWRFLERTGAQGVAFIVSIVLARLLSPDVYGIIALVSIFTIILNVFVDSGMGNALIQKQNADDLDFSTVFYFNICLCSILYICLFIAAPYISKFYNDYSLTPVIRVLGLTIVISGVKNVQQAYVSKHLLFKKFFFSTLGGTIGAAIVGIALAYYGFGVWALVGQQVFNAFVDTCILWITVDWHPKLLFSFKRLKTLYTYGWKLLVSSLIDTLYNNVQQLIIGKWYSSSDLAYYNQGRQFPNLIITNINSSIDSVLLPVISLEQDNKGKIKSMTRRAIKTSSFIIWPMMIGLAAVAEPLVKILLTDKWIGCVPFLRIFCISFAFYPIHTANLNAIKAMGRSDLFLKLEVVKKVIGLTVLMITMNFGVFVIACGLLFTAISSSFINAYPNKRLMNYSYREQIRDIYPFIFLSALMAVIIYPISILPINSMIIILLQIIAGGFVYIFGSKLLHFDSFDYIWNFVLKFLKNRGGK